VTCPRRTCLLTASPSRVRARKGVAHACC
jgi:hypothetical protein